MEMIGAPHQNHSKALDRALLRRMRCYCYALAYILAVHYAYVGYIHPTFAYAFYRYLPFSTVALFSTYFIAWIPILVYRSSDKPAQAAVALIYALLYVPIQLSLLFQVERSYDRLFWVQAMLAGSMMVLFLAAKGGKRRQQPIHPRFQVMDGIVVTVTLVTVYLMVMINREHMRFSSFADVYELRSEAAAAVGQTRLYDYLASWLIFCFISYLFARGLVHRKWSLLLLGVFCGVLEYMAAGHKAPILMLPLTLGLYWLWGTGQHFLSRLLLAVAGLMVFMTLMFPDAGVGGWAKSILLIRLVGSSGWLACRYLEFFPTEGVTYYSHIGPIGALTGMYPYGDLSLGQMISLATTGTTEANHNASFWASDGIAALGPIGILVVTPMVAALLYAINRFMAGLDRKFVVLWMCGFYMALLNVPLSTALLSGGGLIIFVQAWALSKTGNQQRRAVQEVTMPDTLSRNCRGQIK